LPQGAALTDRLRGPTQEGDRLTPEEVLQSIEREAPRRGLPIIGPKRGIILDEVVEGHRPSTVLEVGTLVGYSAIRIGRHLRPGQMLTCVEVRDDMAKIARSNIENAGLSDRIRVLVGDAKEVLSTLGGPIDMVFLDATKDEYFTYLKACEPKLHRGSVVVADNVRSHAKETGDYLNYVRNSGKYMSSYREAPPNHGVDQGDAVEISVML
jgi:predicted O-methyltransferase YrrM